MRALVLALSALLAPMVCTASAVDTVNIAEAEWRKLSVRHYEFTYRTTDVAFPLEGQAAAVKIRVRHGKPVLMHFAENYGRFRTGDPVPKRLRANFPHSLDVLFNTVRSALEFAENREIFTTYDPRYSFPDRHSNRSREMFDDDSGFVVTEFQILHDL